ncbi:hypothetical protein HHK36_022210 [Tetracentron sinense]|uniref:Lipoyl-binding domain-containing protein n=1 Tax=Tetracentron sinense TaxID=13715 RepID=A0A834YQE0_TETSI|nr:hypothetical protein HHK36_022210 [Tetracentron sinense]
MASSFPAASAAAASVTKTISSSFLPFHQSHCSHSKLSFSLSLKPKLRLSSKVDPQPKKMMSRGGYQQEEYQYVCDTPAVVWVPSIGEALRAAASASVSGLFKFLRPGLCLQSTDIQAADTWVGQRSNWNCYSLVKAQLNEVAADESLNAAATLATKLEVPAQEEKHAKPLNAPSPAALATEESISEFITQVASLVKLVDSRDIVELQLKQLDCEITIRKKEALPQPPTTPPMVMAHSPSPPPLMPSAFPHSPSVASPVSSVTIPSSPSTPAPSPPAAKPAKSSLPPLKCPMAGMFYRSPGPGEPAFVKVGDKVQKGQVICIIEAMKLMNEIEADQSGQIVKILVDDGKPVSVDQPLFVIVP